MTLKSNPLASAVFASCISLSTLGSDEPSHESFGPQKTVKDINRIEITNMQ